MAYFTMNKAADSGLFVVESIRQNKDTVHDNVVELWKKKRPDEPAPNVAGLLELIADDLDECRVEMVDSLGDYLSESSGNEASNVERDDAVRDVRHWYQHTRNTCLNVCSEVKTKEMGFDLATEQHPWRLERQTYWVLRFFGGLDPDAKIEADVPEKQEVAPRNGYIVETLTPYHDRLVQVLSSWISQRRGTEKAFIRKEAALETYKKKFSIYAKLGEMLYRWAGLEEEAKRIKPSTRRLGQRAEVADGPPEPPDADVPDGDAPAGDAPAAPAPTTS